MIDRDDTKWILDLFNRLDKKYLSDKIPENSKLRPTYLEISLWNNAILTSMKWHNLVKRQWFQWHRGIFGFGVVRVIQGRSDWSVMAVGLKRLFYKNKTAVGTGPEIFGRLAIFVFVPMVTVRFCLADFSHFRWWKMYIFILKYTHFREMCWEGKMEQPIPVGIKKAKVMLVTIFKLVTKSLWWSRCRIFN